MKSMRVGVEVGGTFTDLVAIADGEIRITKVPSTPSAPHEGALAALEAAALDLSRVDDLVHGSTVATNAILERKGARTALLVTRGFRDVLLLQRHNRRSIYDLSYRKPEPIVSRGDILEVDERVGADGAILQDLDEASLREQLREFFGRSDFVSVAICFLNSYANPLHERRVAELLAEIAPELTVTCSSDVTREFREYERTSTTSLSAYVQPVLKHYLSSFERELDKRGFNGRFSMMQSNGGRLPASVMAENANTALFSGPAAGVIGATRQAGLSGYRDLITLDMGGTSTDVCLVADGTPALAPETEVDGLPIRTPVLDIITVGAGGGSLVWIDEGGLLRVGPESAGADPGPACYGRGGTRPTVTDAHMIRGTLRAEAFLGGRMSLERDQAEGVFSELAAGLGRSVEEMADDALRVADHNIVRAIQLVSTERGRDPRDYTLVPFGGAGPLHAARVADELNIRTLCVPPNAGVLSAYGLLAADYVRYDTRTQRCRVDSAAPDAVRKMFEQMREDARAALTAAGVEGDLQFSHSLDMRYVGQAFEVPVALDQALLPELHEDRLLELFKEAHHRVFEFGDTTTNRAEVVSFRLGTAVPPESIPNLRATDAAPLTGTTTVFDHKTEVKCRLANRGGLQVAETLPGPALIEDETSTIYVPAAWSVRRDEHDNLILERQE